MNGTASQSLVISYLVLRRFIGFLGIGLPLVLAIGGWWVFSLGIQSSISAYYHTPMGDVFVGTLCAIGVFLMSYKGYERKDDIAGDLACIFAIGVALVPTAPDLGATPLQELMGTIHLVFASAFFLTLAWFSLFLFTKSDPSLPPTPRKRQRNAVYRLCGILMLLCLAGIVLVKIVPGFGQSGNPVYWLEALAITAFGLSWLVKGEAILADQPPAAP